MKKVIALLLLTGLTQMALAQGTIVIGNGPGGGFGFTDYPVTLGISFSPLPGSAGTNQPSGSASFGTPFPALPGQFPVSREYIFYFNQPRHQPGHRRLGLRKAG